MRKLYICLLVCFSCMLIRAENRVGQNSFSDLQKEFKNVSSAYRSAPFWVWNYKVTKPEIDRMLSEFKENGFGGVFVHPRYGMITEYLSDDWFNLYAYTIQQGEKLGLDIWLYDENAYPSGFAGGLLPSQMPESYNQGQGLKPFVMKVLPEDYADYFVILSVGKDDCQDITSSAASYLKKEGHYILYKKTYYPENTQPSRAWYAGFSYTDLLLPGVTEKFIEITMSGYEKHFNSRFGKSIKGIFSDEINIRSSGGFRWTPDLFDTFEKQYGYDLRPNMPSLHLQLGNWKKVRYDYSKLLLNLFVDRWAKPWYEYCSKNNLTWTGHYWEQSWPGIDQVPDNMAMNAWQQMPGIDMLSNSFDEERTSAMFGNVRVVKEAKSAANQLGRKRLLCEAYGGGGWDMSFKDFKRHSDWLNVMGVNFMNQHLSHMSFLGVRKYDWPPMFCPMAPWWNDYKVMNEYLARMSFATTLGEQKNDVLVWEPTTTTWMYSQHIGNDGNQVSKVIADSFQQFITELSKNQVEYDLGCEHIIANEGRVEAGKFIVGQCTYSKVVIPELVENMDAACFHLLKRYVEEGGLLLTCSRPRFVDGIESPEIEQLFNDKRVVMFERSNDPQIVIALSNPQFSFGKLKGGNLFHLRKQFKDGHLLLLTNSSMSETSEFSVETEGKEVVEMDALTGDLYSYPSQQKGDKVILAGQLEPAGSLLLFISKEAQGIQNKRLSPVDFQHITSTDKTKISRLKDNALLIDYLDLEQKDSIRSQMYFMDANFEVFRKAGFKDGNPWFRAVQFKQDIINRDVSGAPGFKTTYSFDILSGLKDFSTMKLLCERASMYKIEINGILLNSRGEAFLDKDFSLFPIGKYLHSGTNRVTLSIDHFNVEAEIEPIYILGDFSVIASNNKWAISALSNKEDFVNTKELGAPFYPWEMNYTKMYDIKQIKDTYWVSVPEWKGSVVQIWVNDKKAGIIFSNPNRLNITNCMKAGVNKIEVRVLGGMDNFFGPHHSRSKDSTPPWDWQKHTGSNDANAYILSDYGLLSDFELYNAKYK